MARRTPRREKKVPGGRKKITLKRYLDGLAPDALRDLVREARDAVPEFAEWLEERRVLAGGELGALAMRAAALIAAMPAEPDWDHSWGGRGGAERTDYDALKRSLDALLQAGGADAILDLAPELLRKGIEEVDLFHHDDGLGDEIQTCLEVAWRALPKSSLTPSGQLLFAIDLHLADDYGLVPDHEPVKRRHRKKATWSAVADVLGARVEALPAPGPDAKQRGWYHRRQVVDAAIDALCRAGRAGEAEAARAGEARSTGAYTDWVRWLLEEGRAEEAEQRALEGLANEKEPDRRLHELLREAVEAQSAWPRLTALRAEQFRASPSFAAYGRLLDAAGKARVKRAVRKAALAFLEEAGPATPTGFVRLPRQKNGERWGLPALPETARLPDSRYAGRVLVRLEIALDDGRPTEILACYDRLLAARREERWFGSPHQIGVSVAKAVKATHPERALGIYGEAVERLVGQTKPGLYPEAGRLLKAMCPLYRRVGKPKAWGTHVAELRNKHARKRKFIEVLDALDA